MKYHELPKKYQAEALRRAAGAWNEMYEEQGLPPWMRMHRRSSNLHRTETMRLSVGSTSLV